ncbi:MAG TPA: glycosyl hydrolase family 65 protein [Levilinea sp.]|nr:glycosyl hydrolase family 65 protein [Levilinea sp.]
MTAKQNARKWSMGMVEQILSWGRIEQRRWSAPDTMFANTGRRMYVIGDIDGGFRPRSNPYDLHTYGRPDPKDPLADELQGVWAQPVKGLDGYSYTIQHGAERWKLAAAECFIQSFAAVEFHYRRGDLRAIRKDYAALDQPVLFSVLSLANMGSRPVEAELIFQAHFDLEDAWFTSLGARRNRGELLAVVEGRLAARAEVLPDAWGVAVGGDRPANGVHASSRRQNPSGEMHYRFRLEAQQEQSWAFGMVIEITGGVETALNNLDAWMAQREQMLAEKEAHYRQLAVSVPRLITPDPAFDAAFALAGANLQALEAESPPLGRYFYAGLEMFPFWFSVDAAYSTSGLLASGFEASVKNHVRTGARFAAEGAIPHQVSPAGHVVFPSNAQETAQWVTSIWDVYRWTGDRAFLQELYPAALKGLFAHTLGKIDPDGDGYPSGPGVVEVSGMGEEKLDAAVYTWEGLKALEAIAKTIGDEVAVQRVGEAATWIAKRFDQDWWEEAHGSYSMSLDRENRRLHMPHWAIITPLEAGLASEHHAAVTLETIRARYLNAWGIKHTVGSDERVWTLPTALLSRAAYRYGEAELGFAMLQKIALTLEHGSIGMFHELIPEGACFIQLWSAATFRRGLIEDLLGVQVNCGAHTLTIAPQLPAAWDEVWLENLAFGEHVVDVAVNQNGVEIRAKSGAADLAVTCKYKQKEKALILKAGTVASL